MATTLAEPFTLSPGIGLLGGVTRLMTTPSMSDTEVAPPFSSGSDEIRSNGLRNMQARVVFPTRFLPYRHTLTRSSRSAVTGTAVASTEPAGNSVAFFGGEGVCLSNLGT